MSAFDDEAAPGPARKVAYEVGQDLYALSVDELRERVSALESEIARLGAEIEKKSAHKGAADLFFKR